MNSILRRRRALMGAKGEDLILSDLLTLDGIMNTRNGHNASATKWEDLSGNDFDTAKVGAAGNLVWANNHAVYDATDRGQYISHDFFVGRTAGSIELVVQITGNGNRTINGFQQGFVLSNRTGTDSSPKGFHSYSYNNGGISSYVDNTSLGYSAASSGVAYICWTFNGNTADHYLNGEQSHTASITYADLTGKGTLRIGYESISGGYVAFPHCHIYRIGIHSKAFTAAEVADRYKRFKARFNIA